MDKKLKEDMMEIIKRIPLYLNLIYSLYIDKELPKKAKAILSMALAYNISPIDLIPDIIPLVGQIDNIYFTLKLLKRSLIICPEDIVKKHLENFNITLENIDKDINTSKQAMKEIRDFALNTSKKTIKITASTVYNIGKKFLKNKKNK